MNIREIDAVVGAVNDAVYVTGRWSDDWRAPFLVEGDGTSVGITMLGRPIWDDDNHPWFPSAEALERFLRQSFCDMADSMAAISRDIYPSSLPLEQEI